MKKIILSLFLFGIVCDQLIAQPLKKGQNSINVYYGVSIVRTFYTNYFEAIDQNVKISGLGPIGLVYEHMVTDKIGVGGEFGYATTKATYTDSFEEYNFNTNTFNTVTYNYKATATTIRAQLRMNVHFTNSDKFDAYGFMSAGYRGLNWSFESNDPSLTSETFPTLVPFGVKIGLGLRYFFTENIGIQTEIALGSPAFSGGLAFKF
jgi:hypothetical protein